MNRQRPTIAFLSDFYLGDYQTTLHNAIESAAKALDMNLLCIVGRSVDTPHIYDRIHNKIYSDITEESVSGIVMLGTSLSHYCGTKQIISFCKGFAPIPMCNIGLEVPDVPSILLNNRRFEEIPIHLIDFHGCRHFAYIGGPSGNEEAQKRRLAFLDVLANRRISFNPRLEESGLFTVQSGFNAASQLLNKGLSFDALVAANDEMALGAMIALRQSGILVGETVRVMGFDDIPSARFSSPPLSTMQTPLLAMGKEAITLIHRQMKGEPVPLLTRIDPELVCRASCGCWGQDNQPTIRMSPITPFQAVQSPKHDLTRLLKTELRISDALFPNWHETLVNALFEELDGQEDAFNQCLTRILNIADQELWIADELQRAITLLRSQSTRLDYPEIDLHHLWDKARVHLFNYTIHRQAEKLTTTNATGRLFAHQSHNELNAILSRDTIMDAVTVELQTIGIRNGIISVYTTEDQDELECLVAFSKGRPVSPQTSRFFHDPLLPPCLDDTTRFSNVVMVLSKGSERLGVMMLEFGGAEFYYETCREHMSDYLKNIAYHQAQVQALQEETAETKRELEMQHHQKLESLGILAGGIAHDFNNMLSAILGNLDVALIDIESETPNNEPILECKTVVKHAAGLCRQLLAYSGKGKFIVHRINLNHVLRDIETLLKMAIPKNVVLYYDLDEQLPDIEGDESQLNQIFVNLVINAAESMSTKPGNITIYTDHRRYSEAELTQVMAQSALGEGHYLTVSIQDTGCGMEDAVLNRIFDPFFTTKFTGRGLGLAAVLGIVRGHRGGIRVTSKQGIGTTFDLFFPTLPNQSTAPKSSSVPPFSKGRGTILIADDEPTVLRVAKRLLERMGFSVIAVSDGQEAVDTFKEMTDAIDGVLLDLSMPRLGGLGAMDAIRHIRPHLPIILTSGFTEEAVLSDKGPAAFIQKPYDAETLINTLEDILG